ncbi:helix-turn-helix domain-containing protein (plasmid) [Legionella lytica]|uniref:Helix-turn-helix domain-containing protein n=1 Tax=Legionella lytica TaxID=96232 RepID=A0ABY4YDG6_9GAMM|nr:helix-turn-helix domain-containing protein [Legionella lytica]USQ15305.1 helix-turn-helix domain-containing protein [Legionella lytica]
MAKQIKRIENPDFDEPLTAELIGKLIKARRTQSALRLEDAAALCGVAKHTLMKIEHGKATCQLGSVLQICASLGINLYAKPWDKIDENEWR